MKRFDVAVVGAVGVDTYVFFSGTDIDFSVEGQFSENLDCVGLSGGYSSISFARLRCRTAVIGFVGDDHNGKFVRESLESQGINTEALLIDPCGTKRSVNFMYSDGRRRSFYDSKGSMTTIPDTEKSTAVIVEARLAHVSMVNWTRYLLPRIRELGLTISCDLQDIVDPEDDYRRDFIEYADVLFFSSVNKDNPEPIIEKYLSVDSEKIIVAGMGKNGCALGTKEGIRRFPSVEFGPPVVDTTGAGDSLAAGFLTSRYFHGYSLEESILRGQIAARFACSVKGDSSRLIEARQLDAAFRKLGNYGHKTSSA